MNNSVPEFRVEEKYEITFCDYLSPLSSSVHYHRHIEFIIVTKGTLTLEIEGKTKIMNIGDCAFIFPYVMHSYKDGGNPERFIAILAPECLGNFGEIMLKYRPLTPFISAHALKHAIPNIQMLTDYLASQYCRASDPVIYLKQLSYLTHIFSSLICLTKLEKSENKHSLYSDAVKLCCDNFRDESFDTDKLSEMLNLSVSRTRQIFSENMNISPKKYISLLRINHAQSLLTNTFLPMSLISDDCGYGSIRTFNREFSSVCGVSPSKFRESNKK